MDVNEREGLGPCDNKLHGNLIILMAIREREVLQQNLIQGEPQSSPNRTASSHMPLRTVPHLCGCTCMYMFVCVCVFVCMCSCVWRPKTDVR